MHKDENGIVSKMQEEDNAEGNTASTGWNQSGGQGTGQMYGGFGFNGNQSGYPGMEWNQANGFNPMMQMQMQNNMPNGEWGGFPNMMGSFAQ